jgi:NAD(P)-dependent dehydrogenase (short-subunit alcohol dehydrogenase family)
MLKGKVAIVTGASRGIGEGVAMKMAQYGAKVIIADLNLNQAEETAASIKNRHGDAAAVKVDVSHKVDCDAAVEKAIEEFGTLDILVNCAGINTACKLIDMTDEIWDKINDVNLKGTMYMCQAAAKVFVKKAYGRIVNIGSIAGKIGEAMNGAYCVSKAGVHMLTQVLALELADYGVTVNAVCPGPANTIIMKEVFEQRGPLAGMTPEEFKNEFLKDIPLKRMAEPEDVAELASFLASDRASYITGSAYTLAGGKILV